MADQPAQVALSTRLYPRKCIGVAVDAFTDLCEVEVVEESPHATVLQVQPLSGAAHDVLHDFLNYALMASLERHLSGQS